jgi:hypothetical protein
MRSVGRGGMRAGGRGGPVRAAVYGMAAGAAGTTALNVVTYLDMTLRGRPASTTPQEVVRRVEEAADVSLDRIGSGGEPADNRRDALGALLGIVTGVGVGAAYGLLRPWLPRPPWLFAGLAVGAGANVGTVAPMAALGVSDPRDWTGSSWAADIVPHLADGVATVAVFEAIYGRRGRYRRTSRSGPPGLRLPGLRPPGPGH